MQNAPNVRFPPDVSIGHVRFDLPAAIGAIFCNRASLPSPFGQPRQCIGHICRFYRQPVPFQPDLMGKV